jgi:CheY-like chemotaxis protein
MAGILIVDDDPTIRAMFARALKPLGDVETAANGGEALRLLGAKRYGVVLLDLHMPMIDGFVLLHTLSSKGGPNRDTAIFVITADTSEQARLKALRRHAVFLLTKPVPLATLTALVQSALKKAAARAAAGDGDEDGVLEPSVDLPLPPGLTGNVAPTVPSSSAPPASPARQTPAPGAAGRMTPPVRPVVGARGADAPLAGGPKKPGG